VGVRQHIQSVTHADQKQFHLLDLRKLLHGPDGIDSGRREFRYLEAGCRDVLQDPQRVDAQIAVRSRERAKS
jgi:hypothetical protein